MANSDDHMWWSEDTVAVVTGGSKGIGLEVCRHLAKYGVTVVLTCRNPRNAEQAIAQLGLNTNNVVIHELDVQSSESVSNLASWLKQEYGGLDILVNNAGVIGARFDLSVLGGNKLDFNLFMADPSLAKKVVINDVKEAKICMDINYYGVKRVTEALLPLLHLRPSPRIVNVTSGFGKLINLLNESLREKLLDTASLSLEFVDSVAKQFVGDLEEGKLEERGWPAEFSAYVVSKAMLNTYTRVLSRDLALCEKKVYVNVVDPGFTKSDMNFHSGIVSTYDAAEGIVWVALLPPGGPTGLFYHNKQPIDF